MTRIVSLTVVLDRDDAIRVSVDGRAVRELLARRLECAAWSSARPTLDELGDASSVLFREVGQ